MSTFCLDKSQKVRIFAFQACCLFDQVEEHNTTQPYTPAPCCTPYTPAPCCTPYTSAHSTPPPTAYPLCPASPTNPHRP